MKKVFVVTATTAGGEYWSVCWHESKEGAERYAKLAEARAEVLRLHWEAAHDKEKEVIHKHLRQGQKDSFMAFKLGRDAHQAYLDECGDLTNVYDADTEQRRAKVSYWVSELEDGDSLI